MATTVSARPWSQQSRVPGWLIVLLMLAGSYATIHFLSPQTPYFVNVYLLQPLCYLLPAGVALWLLRPGWRSMLSTNRSVVFAAVAIAIGQISIMVATGALTTFGQSPYAHTPLAYALNLWHITALLLGREICRWFLVSAFRRRGDGFALLAVSIIFWLADLSPRAFSRLGQPESLFEYLGAVALPSAGREMLATQLALLGGPAASLAYSGLLTLFEWSSPVLPAPMWLIAAMAGVLVPIAGMALLQVFEETDETQQPATQAAVAETAERAQAEKRGGISPFWLVMALLALVLFWFNSGLFGVKPTLVSGISMEPTMHTGDIAVVRQVPVDQVKVGDVIQFRDRGRSVLHRVIKVQQQNGQYVFIAQGDNVASPDDPVSEKAVEGRMLFFIPKVGLLPIKLKQAADVVLR
jgi:signal peptidase I